MIVTPVFASGIVTEKLDKTPLTKLVDRKGYRRVETCISIPILVFCSYRYVERGACSLVGDGVEGEVVKDRVDRSNIYVY